MKLLITTRSDKNIRDLTDLTHPVIKHYADWVGADFLELDHVSGCEHEEGKWHYRIFKHYDLFNEYDRILSLDSDIVITPQAPNIFEEVPYDSIGTVFEDQGTRAELRRETIEEAQTKLGNIGWQEGYINTGVFLTSKIHKNIFQKIDDQYWEGWGFDDIHLAYNINKMKYKLFELDYRFNHMTMFSESWNKSPSRFNSFFIHYAGYGIFEDKFIVKNKDGSLKKGQRNEQIKSDVSFLKSRFK